MAALTREDFGDFENYLNRLESGLGTKSVDKNLDYSLSRSAFGDLMHQWNMKNMRDSYEREKMMRAKQLEYQQELSKPGFLDWMGVAGGLGQAGLGAYDYFSNKKKPGTPTT